MFRMALQILLGLFLVIIVGSIILETFPQLQPLWQEFVDVVIGLYESSKVKYGTIATVGIIIAIGVLAGTSRKSL
ncbi:hypothetical protein JCM21714_2078 [Gracilibacillus boraciitolerans JCM 21714]|uniref:Uncharacterized protein n=1 Tax=Gracilibacillus boraciitolerans JCM 21714 TaxID=1298598 RepID=W4VI23_9BACI|nr:hypothetical protein [Gracilibacillus boraciitolerans]GAE93045.1 hypothetical protein JCM21714_2078 [Gracilibacillus boraciitolerans JCM 21714]